MKFIDDTYKATRGGKSQLLDICCRKCREHICYYQKDGPGHLRRMYNDRMVQPVLIMQGKTLKCACGEVLGISIVYSRETRPAFRLFVDAIQKRRITLKSLAKREQ